LYFCELIAINNQAALPKNTEESNLLVCMDSTSSVTSRVKLLTESLGRLPLPVAHPALIIVSGLPGSGKSYFAKRLAEKIPAVILESDALRKTLFTIPDYSPRESGRLFETIHALIGWLLERRFSIILDATNLSERHRAMLYHIAEKNSARLIIAYLEAPPEVISDEVRRTLNLTLAGMFTSRCAARSMR
jgi:adenylylsulfate kinase-like enzyme